ncbi:hypothetical protein LJR153_007326 [Paenibacillus sp. LjRoot153]|uniref:hypothetical protein n=1 Tax=Paenibacillus sp. LjRoot153 TaxID=3342270 RepID=UPI003ECED5E1
MNELVKRMCNFDRYGLSTHKRISKHSQRLENNNSKTEDVRACRESMLDLEKVMPVTPVESDFFREARKSYSRFLKRTLL